ncbi:MAG TPA: LysM peptidoglycan-binding domain-containing protein [Thermomicrobiales bacterium]|nr:LysM peptidoglycan-binding domain-containing protein [Thermomicrobiales bacterium]
MRPAGWGIQRATPRRVAVATLAVLVLMIGAVGTSLADDQYRYVVQSGDTLQSVATEFGVDPDAIVASSYMPDGTTLDPGQVIIIPEQGQSPSDAAAMASEREGTSPYASAAYTVQWGDTVDSIASQFGVDPGTLADLNGISDPTSIRSGDRLVIPGSADGSPSSNAGAASATTTSDSSGLQVPNVSTHVQERNLSCEYASVYIATAAFGNPIPEDVMINNIPVTLNPHDGFRGNIDGPWGNDTDYGIYPEALTSTLSDYGFASDIFYGEGDTTQLKAELDAGHPVLTWIAMQGNTREQFNDDGTYVVVPGDHVMVAYGYDDSGIYLSDPAHGEYTYYTWDDFVYMWKIMDGMSMAVYPAS